MNCELDLFYLFFFLNPPLMFIYIWEIRWPTIYISRTSEWRRGVDATLLLEKLYMRKGKNEATILFLNQEKFFFSFLVKHELKLIWMRRERWLESQWTLSLRDSAKAALPIYSSTNCNFISVVRGASSVRGLTELHYSIVESMRTGGIARKMQSEWSHGPFVPEYTHSRAHR